MSRDGSVPGGRLRRLARLARVGTRTGASLLLSDDPRAAAERAAEVLGSLRGLAAKVGQMASYVDGLVPEAHEAVFEQALGVLRSGAPASPWTKVRQTIETELGGNIDDLFASFSPEPFASASIGQVHRAVMRDGRIVAVKVQHPGIEKAIESDLSSGAVVARLVGVVAPGELEAERLYAEVARHFREELDYVREAASQERFAKLFREDPRVLVPEVVRERSSARVLTSLFAEGDELDVACRYPEAERRAVAETLFRFVYRSILVGGLFNADPHPGNYLFRRDGRVVFLDFGCVQELPANVVKESRACHLAAVERDEQAFTRAARRLVRTRGGAYEEDFVRYLRTTLEPIFSSPFRITRAYARGLVTGLYDLKQRAFARGSGLVPLPEGTVLLNRLQVGFYSVLSRLDAEVDYRAIEREFLAEEPRAG